MSVLHGPELCSWSGQMKATVRKKPRTTVVSLDRINDRSQERVPFFRDRVRRGTWSKKDYPIFGSEIPHAELIDVVYLFCSDLLFFSRKFAKNGRHKCCKYEHKNFARENCKSKVAFLQFAYLCAKYLLSNAISLCNRAWRL